MATVYPIRENNYIYFSLDDRYFTFGKDTGRLFHEYYTIAETLDKKKCDSIDIHHFNTSIFYYRK